MQYLLCLVALILTPPGTAVSAQRNDAGLLDSAREMLSRGDCEGVLRLLPGSEAGPPEFDFLRGMALARLERLQEARTALETGFRKAPHDPRFPLELAGIAFRQKRLDDARFRLRQALRGAPSDPYTIEFLATVYFLQGNLPAALGLWNRVDKPIVETVRTSPNLRLNPILLDRVLAIRPASLISLRDYRTTKARIEALDVVKAVRFDMSPRGDQKYDLMLHGVEKNGWGSGWVEACLGTLGGLPYQTAYPAYFNIRRSAWNWKSILRWDSRKERFQSTVAGPLGHNPDWRLAVHVDARDESWQLEPGYEVPGHSLQRRIIRTGLDVTSFPSARWEWSAGAAVSVRRGSPAEPHAAPDLFREGTALEQRLSLRRELVFLPEQRFTVRASALSEAARFFGTHSQRFERLQAGVVSTWSPGSGQSLTMTGRLRGGAIFGQAPFEERFSLGLERDNNLGLRGHPGTAGGMKGRGPFGRRYLLMNLDFQQRIARWSVIELSLGPFVDTGSVCDDVATSGSSRCGKWLIDAGLQASLSMLGGPAITLSLGIDVRTGRGVWFGSTNR